MIQELAVPVSDAAGWVSDVNGGGKVQRGAAAELGDTLGLTHFSLPTMEADGPTTGGTGREATGCIPTWTTGPGSAGASSPTASAGAPPAASTRSTGRPSRRSSTTPSRP